MSLWKRGWECIPSRRGCYVAAEVAVPTLRAKNSLSLTCLACAVMAALRRKILEKKQQEAARLNPPVAIAAETKKPPAPAVTPAVPAPVPTPVAEKKSKPAATKDSESGVRKGFLSGVTLYPEGSNEANPALWRSTANASGRSKVFELITTSAGYEVRGKFHEAGRYLGKEDFEVSRNGFSLRIRGKPDADKQSLVAGLDETVTLPGDTDWNSISAEFKDCELQIMVPRSAELAAMLAQLSLEEAKALAAKHGVVAPALAESAGGIEHVQRPSDEELMNAGEAAYLDGAVDEADDGAPIDAKEQARRGSEAFWGGLAATLGLKATPEGIAKQQRVDGTTAGAIDEAASPRLRDELGTAGFAQLDGWAGDANADEHKRNGACSAAIDALGSKGFPAAFVLLFDEVWASMHALEQTLRPVLGPLAPTHDVAIVNVPSDTPPPAEWAAKRARADAGTASTLFDTPAGGGVAMPQGVTAWLSLTDATPSTSCLHVIPASADPHYRSGEGAGTAGKDVASLVVGAHQHLRALSAPAGSALVWSHRTVHWMGAHAGGAGAPPCHAIAFGLANPLVEGSLLAARHTGMVVPPLDARLALIAVSVLAKHDTAPVRTQMALTLVGMLRAGEEHLSDAALDAASRVGAAVQRALVALLAVGDDAVRRGALGTTETATLTPQQVLEIAESINALAQDLQSVRGLEVVAELGGALSKRLPKPAAPPKPATPPKAPPKPVAAPQPRVVDVSEELPSPQRLPPPQRLPAAAPIAPPERDLGASVGTGAEAMTYEEVD